MPPKVASVSTVVASGTPAPNTLASAQDKVRSNPSALSEIEQVILALVSAAGYTITIHGWTLFFRVALSALTLEIKVEEPSGTVLIDWTLPAAAVAEMISGGSAASVSGGLLGTILHLIGPEASQVFQAALAVIEEASPDAAPASPDAKPAS